MTWGESAGGKESVRSGVDEAGPRTWLTASISASQRGRRRGWAGVI
jgi:hypothetical protein